MAKAKYWKRNIVAKGRDRKVKRVCSKCKKPIKHGQPYATRTNPNLPTVHMHMTCFEKGKLEYYFEERDRVRQHSHEWENFSGQRPLLCDYVAGRCEECPDAYVCDGSILLMGKEA